MAFNSEMHGGNFIPAKMQFYVNDGFGRDTYIYNSNGAFCPEKQPTQIHEVGKCLRGLKNYFRFIRNSEITALLHSCSHSLETYCLHEQWNWT